MMTAETTTSINNNSRNNNNQQYHCQRQPATEWKTQQQKQQQPATSTTTEGTTIRKSIMPQKLEDLLFTKWIETFQNFCQMSPYLRPDRIFRADWLKIWKKLTRDLKASTALYCAENVLVGLGVSVEKVGAPLAWERTNVTSGISIIRPRRRRRRRRGR